MNNKGQLGLYVHWPFCLAKCPYCDFNSHVREAIDQERWRSSYIKALGEYALKTPGRIVRSIYFGGGTPSLMLPETVEAIIDEVQRLWPIANDIEITLEANPTSVEIGKFQAFREAGVNRVSLGVQALNDSDLKFLGREHSAAEAIKAIDTARNVFERYSFDLMYARPEQTLERWEAELRDALDYADGHLSLYQLTIERNTPFHISHAQGKFSIPDEYLASDFYNLTQDILAAAERPAYEVSNHARAGQESVHNMIYWTYGDYIGLGPGAHGRLTLEGKKYATREHSAPEKWLDLVDLAGDGAHPYEEVKPKDQVLEALMMGLRIRDGVSLPELGVLGGGDWHDFIDEDMCRTLVAEGWGAYDGETLKLNREGWLRLNAIVPVLFKF